MTEQEFRALVEQSHLLDELTRHAGWPVLVDYIKSEVERPKVDRILNGGIENIEEYKYESGYCLGMNRVLRAPELIGNAVLRERVRREERETAEGAEE